MKLRTSYHKFFTIGTAILSAVFAYLTVSTIAKTYADDGSDKKLYYVTIHDGENSLTVKTDAKTVEDVLKRSKIELNQKDLVDPELDTEIDSDNYHITLYRARPVVVTDGKTKKYLMTANYDKKSLVKEAGFIVDSNDEIKSVQTNKNILETGLTETYEIIKNENTEVGDKYLKVDTKKTDFSKIATPTVKKEETVLMSVPAFVTNPNEATCKAWIRAAGISEYDLDTAYWIITKESHCRYNATNRSSGAYGIPQSLPGDKMAKMGADWRTNPITQIKWMNWYVNSRYGGWQGAKTWWLNHNWY